MKLRVSAGKLALFSAYAPVTDAPDAVKNDFYHVLGDQWKGIQNEHLKIVLGDFNARLHERKAGEEYVVGPHIFGKGPNQINKMNLEEA